MKPLIFLLLTGFSAFSQAAVYQYVDENGNVVFTDKPVNGAFERKLKEPAVIKFKKQASETEVKSGSEPTQKEEAQKYSNFAIESPELNAAIRDNAGNVTVVISAKPELQTKFGHYIQLTLDGKRLDQKYASNRISLNNLDRGSHTVSATLLNKTGSVLQTTTSVTFFLQRYSKKAR